MIPKPQFYERKRLKFVASINNETLPEDTDSDFILKYIDIGNVDSSGKVNEIVKYRFEDAPSRARRIVKDGDVIISTVRTYLQAIAPIQNPPKNLIVSTGFAVVRPFTKVFTADYCKYVLREPSFIAEVEKESVGVSYPAINASDLGNLLIPIPPLAEQQAIAEMLDHETERLDELITEKERLVELLQEKRRALITNAVTRGLEADAPTIDSGIEWLGEIPQHWRQIRLKFLAQERLMYGANEAGLEDNPKFPRFVRITDIAPDGSLRPDTFKSLEPDVAEPYLLRANDILFARSGATVGKTFIYRESWGEACFAGYLIRFRCNVNLASPDFLYLFSLGATYWFQINESAIQSTIQNFSAEKYADLIISLPPLKEQKEIVEYIETETAKIDCLQAATQETIELLKERRASLIAAAVTGKINVAV